MRIEDSFAFQAALPKDLQTWFIGAVCVGDCFEVKELLESETTCHIIADYINHVDPEGFLLWTPLFLAINNRDLAMCSLLIEYGANPRLRVSGNTPEKYAREIGFDAFERLLEQ